MSSLAFEFGFKDLIDILLVAVILYETYRLLRKSGVANLFWGVLAFIVVWFLVSFVFQLELTSALFDRVISVGAIALIVIFQEEIRMFFNRLGGRFSSWKIFRNKKGEDAQSNQQMSEVIRACRHLSSTKTGALIVISKDSHLKEIIDTGERLDAAISARLIENIFFKNTPLHDGAMILEKGKIVAAACILPVSKNPSIPKHMGLRHRAAVGLTEKTDATCIVVSEETGNISFAENGNIRKIEEDELFLVLHTTMPAL
ncbi:MAG: diadenylate cyclase CdaA [Paludibacteraceae bacterium]|nr:diadenylate cyclase CdaA [Paludibacteraceae bacterium]MEE0951390.1 diadenylate cyclase CdaA [Paludibacteraceae bacterium]MEE1070684.1 diadenylate cyclase CdaA [Paludibacteraceae bacterium]